MQLYSRDAEIKCIATLTNPEVSEAKRLAFMGRLSKEFFHYPPCEAAFNRIDKIVRKKFNLVDFDDLMEDPALEEDFRDQLKDADVTPSKSKKGMDKLFGNLDTYRKVRALYHAIERANEVLSHEAIVDIDLELDVLSTEIARARRDIGSEQQMMIIGKDHNADDVFERVMNKEREPLYPTGFTDYDKVNGGIPEEGVFLLAATTSGGKSAVLLNILSYFYYKLCLSVFRVSLEMGDDQELTRMISSWSGVPIKKIKMNQMTMQERKRVKRAFRRFKKHGKKNKCQFVSMSPDRGMTAQDVFRMTKPFGFPVVAIDYVGLLEGVDVDNQWQVLNAIIREAKIYSREAKCLVIILAQLDDTSDKLRYAKGMKEHVDVMWKWNYTKPEQRDLRTLPIVVDKARDGELFGFPLEEQLHIMRVRDMDNPDSDDLADLKDNEDDQEAQCS
jgi:hypothetical protein